MARKRMQDKIDADAARLREKQEEVWSFWNLLEFILNFSNE